MLILHRQTNPLTGIQASIEKIGYRMRNGILVSSFREVPARYVHKVGFVTTRMMWLHASVLIFLRGVLTRILRSYHAHELLFFFIQQKTERPADACAGCFGSRGSAC